MKEKNKKIAEDAELSYPGSEKSAAPVKNKKTAEEVGLRYLSNRMRTTAEMRGHLQEKGYSTDEIEAAVRGFTELRYLDDEHYAWVYAEYAFGKGRAGKRILAELAEKGITGDVAANAIEDYKYESGIEERELALEVAQKALAIELEGTERELDERLSGKIARKLNGLGYDAGTIYGVLAALREKNTDK